MIFEKTTIDILKNFSSINTNILIKPGSVLNTLAVPKHIMASVKVKQEFDKQFGIFNLNEFLGVLSLFEEPEVTFQDTFMTIKKGKNRVKYVYADPSILVYPEKKIKMPSTEVSVELNENALAQSLKAASILGSPDIAFTTDGDEVILKVLDKKNPSSNSYIIELNQKTNKKFTVYFKVENLKMLSDDYQIDLSSQNIARMLGKKVGVEYFIAAEQDSTFE